MLSATLALALSLSAAEVAEVPVEAAGTPLVLTLSGAFAGAAPDDGGGERFAQASTQSGRAPLPIAEPALRATLACALGTLIPGLGHLASGTYLYRGLAFSAAYVTSLFGAIAFAAVDVEGLGGPHAVTGGILLMVATAVIYVWSLVDALTLAADPVVRDRW
jgi:hypothetical protein